MWIVCVCMFIGSRHYKPKAGAEDRIEAGTKPEAMTRAEAGTGVEAGARVEVQG